MARLDFVVSQALSISKAAAQAKIREHLVRVNGAVVSAPSWQVVLGGVEEVTVVGEPVKSLFHRLVIMHKPANCLSARPRKERKGGAAPGSAQAEAEAATCIS